LSTDPNAESRDVIVTLHNAPAQSRATTTRPAAISPFRLKPSPLLLACLLLVVSSVAWRKGAYFSGGADIVVLSKAALTFLALGIALLMPRKQGAWGEFRASPVLWLVGYLTISVIGAILNSDGFASIVLAIRLSLLALALLLLIISNPWEDVISGIATAMLLLAAFGALTGLSSLAETGRLYGGIPPLNANEIALLVSLPILVLFWKCVESSARHFEYFALLPLFGVAWLTGARTTLAALVVALMLVVATTHRVPQVVAVGLAAAIPVVLYMTYFTPLVNDFAGRGGTSNITTLNSRTVAWTAAVRYSDTLIESLFGSGLALKTIPVSAMYRTEQILDSTWMSALIQVGYLGIGLLLILVIGSLIKAFQLPAPERSLILATVALVTIVSVLESGMFDTSPAFIIFFTVSIISHRVVAKE
jgi:hypothetical protein